jgi:hypothetical protein
VEWIVIGVCAAITVIGIALISAIVVVSIGLVCESHKGEKNGTGARSEL